MAPMAPLPAGVALISVVVPAATAEQLLQQPGTALAVEQHRERHDKRERQARHAAAAVEEEQHGSGSWRGRVLAGARSADGHLRRHLWHSRGDRHKGGHGQPRPRGPAWNYRVVQSF